MLLPAKPPVDAKAALASAPLLCDVGDEALEDIARAIEWVFLPGGELLFRPGGAGDSLFLVVSGQLQILEHDGSGAEYPLRNVLAGGHVGELPLLTREPGAQAVRATRDTYLARVTRAHFEQLAKRHPQLALNLARQLAQSTQPARRARARTELPATIAVVPLSRDAPLREFLIRLEESFSPVGRVRRVCAEDAIAELGPMAADASFDDMASAQASQWLNALERQYGVVIYEASAEPSAWSRRCVRQADLVVAIALADAGPRDDQVAPAFFDAITGHEGDTAHLVLLHSDGSLRPHLSHVWRALHPFAAHYHVRMTVRSDFERLTRHLARQAVGLVLSGGGARAFAYGGVLRALEEANVPVDIIGGTSAGALVAAHYAYGHDIGAIIELNRAWGRRHLLDYTLPLLALLSARRPKRILERSFGDARIEDLWLPFFCVSTDLTQAELVVHRTGPVAQWVRASLSVPGIMPPAMSNDGNMLVDGAVLNNLPVDVMRRLTAGPIIAVDICPSVDLAFGRGHRHTPPPWQLMRSAVEHSERRRFVPPIFRILHRTALLRSERQRREAVREADLYLTPPVTAYDMFDWDSVDELINIGYRHAAPIIAEWKRQQASSLSPH